MKTLAFVALPVALATIPAETVAQQCLQPVQHDRPTIGLALGGGGARGYAHVGALKLLEELRVPVDFVSGTSMGSLVGALTATGMTTDDLAEVVGNIDWDYLFEDATSRSEVSIRRKRDDDLALFGAKVGLGEKGILQKRGLLSGQKIQFLFESIVDQRTQVDHFDQLPIPFRAVAADVITGDEVVIDRGSLALAMRASMAVPAVFTPVPFGDDLLVDGGIVNNVPADTVRNLGADIVIAIDVGTPPFTREELSNVVTITTQLTGLMMQENVRYQRSQMGQDDLWIVPDLGRDFKSTEFDRMEEIAAVGYSAMAAYREELSAYSLTQDEYDAYRRQIAACVPGLPTIQWVEVSNRSRFRDDVIERRLSVEVGQPLDVGALRDDIEQIYALGFLKTVTYEVRSDERGTGIHIDVEPDARGTRLIEHGLDIFGADDSSAINLRVGLLKTDIDDLGSELRLLAQVGEERALLAELYKPLGPDLRYIILPRLFMEQQNVFRFDDDGNRLDSSEVEQYGARLFFGREFGRSGALFAGINRAWGDVRTNIGQPGTVDFDYDLAEWQIAATYDRLDDFYFPTQGSRVDLSGVVSSDTLGADDDYEQILLTALKANTWGRHTLIGGLVANTTLDDDAPIFARFRAGGFLRLSGFSQNELSGQHYAQGLGVYRYEFADAGGLLPSYIGGTVEYGNVSETGLSDAFDDGIFAGSAYLGFDSPIGPLYLGYGFAEGGRDSFFLRMGNVFGTSTIGR